MNINRSNLQELGHTIHNQLKQRWIGKQLIELMPQKGNIVVDGLRFPEDHSIMVETFGPSFKHIHIKAHDKVIEDRTKYREKDDIPVAISQTHLVENQVNNLASLSDVTIFNDLTLNDLIEQIDIIVDS